MSKKINVAGQDYDLPEGVQALGSEDLYKVDLSLISVEGGFNPRRITNKGFDKESMDNLLSSIREQGILSPLICRWAAVGDELSVTIVEGERRFLTVKHLLESDEQVWSREHNKYLPASEVFDALQCRVVVATRDEALQYAASVQDCTVDWGEGAKTALIKKMREEGYTDERIITIFSKSSAWLREEDKICTLDDNTWNAYIGMKINRVVALSLVKVEDLELRQEYLNAALQTATSRHKEEVEAIEEQITTFEEKIESAKVELELAEKEGDEEAIVAAKEKLEKVQKKVEAKKEEKQNKKPQAKTKDLTVGAQTVVVSKPVDNDVVPQNPLRPGKIKKLRNLLQDIYKNEGVHDEEEIADKNSIMIAISCLTAILEGNQNLVSVLREACKTNVASKSLNRAWSSNNDSDNDNEEEEEEDDFGFGRNAYSEDEMKEKEAALDEQPDLVNEDEDFNDLPEEE